MELSPDDAPVSVGSGRVPMRLVMTHLTSCKPGWTWGLQQKHISTFTFGKQHFSSASMRKTASSHASPCVLCLLLHDCSRLCLTVSSPLCVYIVWLCHLIRLCSLLFSAFQPVFSCSSSLSVSSIWTSWKDYSCWVIFLLAWTISSLISVETTSIIIKDIFVLTSDQLLAWRHVEHSYELLLLFPFQFILFMLDGVQSSPALTHHFTLMALCFPPSEL